jgi:hypothetical protein
MLHKELRYFTFSGSFWSVTRCIQHASGKRNINTLDIWSRPIGSAIHMFTSFVEANSPRSTPRCCPDTPSTTEASNVLLETERYEYLDLKLKISTVRFLLP